MLRSATTVAEGEVTISVDDTPTALPNYYFFIIISVPMRHFLCGSMCFVFWCKTFVRFAIFVHIYIFCSGNWVSTFRENLLS